MSDFDLAVSKLLSRQPNWVLDQEYVRQLDGKTIRVRLTNGADMGLFTLRVLLCDENGYHKPGHVLIALEPRDTQSVVTIIKNLTPR